MHIKLNRTPTKDSTQRRLFLDKLTKKKKEKEILSIEMNQECFDCGRPNPGYISINNGIFICKSCALIHYQFPEEISSIQPKKNFLTDKEILFLYNGGNHRLFNFVTLEYPGLQNYTPDILYKTKAMEYYRDRLKYYTGMRQRPLKPDDLLAYKFIDEDCFDLLSRRKNKSKICKISRIYNYVRQKNDTSDNINSTCSINCNFNGNNNSINFLNPENYSKSIDKTMIKPIIPLQYNDNDSFNQNYCNTFTLVSQQPDISSSNKTDDLTIFSILSRNKMSNRNSKKTRVKYYNKFIYHSPLTSNIFHKTKTNYSINQTTETNVYQKPKKMTININDDLDNNNKNKSNLSFLYSYTQRNESPYDYMTLNRRSLCIKNKNRNTIALKKEYDSSNNTINNLYRSQIQNCKNNIEENDEDDEDIVNMKKIQEQEQKKNKKLIYNNITKNIYFHSFQHNNDNQNSQFSNINTNSSRMSKNNIPTNNEKKYFRITAKTSTTPIKKNQKKLIGQYKKNPLCNIPKTTCFFKNKTSLFKLKKLNNSQKESIPQQSNLINTDFEFSAKANKDKEEQECVEKEALKKLLLEGDIDDKIDELNEDKKNENDNKNLIYSKARITHNDNKYEKINDGSGFCYSIRNKYKQNKTEDGINSNDSPNKNIWKSCMNS